VAPNELTIACTAYRWDDKLSHTDHRSDSEEWSDGRKVAINSPAVRRRNPVRTRRKQVTSPPFFQALPATQAKVTLTKANGISANR